MKKKLDLSSKNLKKLEKNFLLMEKEEETEESDEIETLILDNNHLSKLENLNSQPLLANLKNLSLANNHLIEIKCISKLASLQYVNLLNNSLTNLDGFKQLQQLIWLNLSGNQIKSLDALKSNHRLEYIDASDNSIEHLPDLSNLNQLKTLNLNGNEVATLKQTPINLPKSIENLFLSYNALDDLNEISYLTCLSKLENLCVDSNPCTAYSNYENTFDYRPFVINWCISLVILDGSSVTQKEFLKAEWLYSQGKGRHFKPGQSQSLIEYLIKTCPPSYIQSFDDDVRLSKVLEKKRNYEISSSHNDYFNYQTHKSMNQKSHEIIADAKKPTTNINEEIQVIQIEEKEEASLNLLNNLQFSSSDEPCSDQEAAPASNTNSNSNNNNNINEMNAHAYYDYDNRPIKPLDQNLFNEKLAEFNGSEMVSLVKKVERQRSKTTEPITLNNNNNSKNKKASNLNNLEQFREKPKRQLSFVHPTTSAFNHCSLASPRPNKITSARINLTAAKLSQQQANLGMNRVNKKRSKTQEDLKSKQQVVKSTTPSHKTTTSAMTNNSAETLDDLKSKLDKQRQEMRLQREKHLIEIKNKRIINEQKERKRRIEIESIIESHMNSHIEIRKDLTYEDRCAMRIQAAWRGYLVRSSKKVKLLKLKRMQNQIGHLKSQLRLLGDEHRQMAAFGKQKMDSILSVMRSYAIMNEKDEQQLLIESKIMPLSSNLNVNDETIIDKLKQENEQLKLELSKYKQSIQNASNQPTSSLKNFQKMLDDQEEDEEEEEVDLRHQLIHPPLNVRLQKLNEKSVALKWTHNPKNVFVKLDGYNIYINDELCGQMKSSDQIASINGIQEVGEYIIYLRSFYLDIESDKSNQVVTRLRKKRQVEEREMADSNSSDQEADDLTPSSHHDNPSHMETSSTSQESSSNESRQTHHHSNEALQVNKKMDIATRLQTRLTNLKENGHKPPLSPPRANSPNNNSINETNMLEKRTMGVQYQQKVHYQKQQSRSFDFDSKQESSASSNNLSLNEKTNKMNISSTDSHKKINVNNASNVDLIYSSNEPNLSGGKGHLNRDSDCSLLRQSLSFDQENK